MHRQRLAELPLAALALAFLAAALPAQEADDADAERWSGEVGFSLNASGGNEQLTVLTTSVGLSHLETRRYELSLDGRYRYGRSQGEEVARNLRGGVTLDISPEGRWTPFLFATGESDPFKKLDARINGGGGLKHTFWRDEWDEVSLSGAILASYENLEVADSLGDGISTTALWSWRGRVRREFGEGRRFEQVVFFQPEWDRVDDYLFESQTTARWALSRVLAFTTSFLYEHDSTPAPDVKPDDWALAVGLSLATRW